MLAQVAPTEALSVLRGTTKLLSKELHCKHLSWLSSRPSCTNQMSSSPAQQVT